MLSQQLGAFRNKLPPTFRKIFIGGTDKLNGRDQMPTSLSIVDANFIFVEVRQFRLKFGCRTRRGPDGGRRSNGTRTVPRPANSVIVDFGLAVSDAQSRSVRCAARYPERPVTCLRSRPPGRGIGSTDARIFTRWA